MSGHTPGPWVAVCGNVGGPSIKAPDGRHIADVRVKFIRWQPDKEKAFDLEDCGEEAAANARLIAAAPDLYTEAVRIVEWLERLAAGTETLAKDTRFITLAEANAADAKNYRASAKGLRAAIAKASA